MSFEMISRIKSIYEIQDSTVYFALVDSIVSGKYDPNNFYQEFDYATNLVKEMIHEYLEIKAQMEDPDQKEYQTCCFDICKLQEFLEYLKREEFESDSE